MSVTLKPEEQAALELAKSRVTEGFVKTIEGNIRSNVPSNVQDGDELVIPEGSEWVDSYVNGNAAPYKIAVGVDATGVAVTRNIYAGWLQRVYREVDKDGVSTRKTFRHTGSLMDKYMSCRTKQEGMDAITGIRFKCKRTASPLIKVFGSTETKQQDVFELSFIEAAAEPKK